LQVDPEGERTPSLTSRQSGSGFGKMVTGFTAGRTRRVGAQIMVQQGTRRAWFNSVDPWFNLTLV
jgi:hypothetical protein